VSQGWPRAIACAGGIAVGSAGAAVDFSRAASTRTAMHAGLDARALMPTIYYDVQEASHLDSVFGSIAKNLANLRIVR
jgi:hypothetical protein